MHFNDLRVYRLSSDAAYDIFRAARAFPRQERWDLSRQLLRASRAVPALIAEAWGRKQYPASFSEKLSQALGEAMEVQAWLECAHRCEYISTSDYEKMNAEWQGIGGMIRRMMQGADGFSGRRSGRSTENSRRNYSDPPADESPGR